MKRLVEYKGIIHNVLNDAPFIGAIVIANSCKRNCQGCINEHLKTDEYKQLNDVSEIIGAVRKNGLNEGVIFAGLEWTEQAEDLMALVDEAIRQGLKVMIYTHHEERAFFNQMPSLKNKSIYVKFGSYDPKLIEADYYSYGVKLATSNQYIRHYSLEKS